VSGEFKHPHTPQAPSRNRPPPEAGPLQAPHPPVPRVPTTPHRTPRSHIRHTTGTAGAGAWSVAGADDPSTTCTVGRSASPCPPSPSLLPPSRQRQALRSGAAGWNVGPKPSNTPHASTCSHAPRAPPPSQYLSHHSSIHPPTGPLPKQVPPGAPHPVHHASHTRPYTTPRSHMCRARGRGLMPGRSRDSPPASTLNQCKSRDTMFHISPPQAGQLSHSRTRSSSGGRGQGGSMPRAPRWPRGEPEGKED
jgi:hypothetical protein